MSFTGRNALTICAVVAIFVIAGIISCTSEVAATNGRICRDYRLWTWAAPDHLDGMDKFCTERSQ